ncbi:MAG: DUF1513 domain-containing protein [Bdellovibrionales bacterium]|nr:DUF1513 domain-containing protein [Bdellovibrionales bacterium]
MNRRQALYAITGGLALSGSLGLGMRLLRRQFFRSGEASAITLGSDRVTKDTFLTEAFLDSHRIEQVELPMKEGHSALCLPERKLVCIGHKSTTSLFLDSDNKVIKEIKAPKGYMYGGHGLVFLNQKRVLITAHAAIASSEKDSGLIQVFSLDKMELIQQFSSHGIHPHEIRLLPGEKSYVVTHYGMLSEENNPNPQHFTFGVLNPKLSVFSVETNLPIVHHSVTPNYAIFTHMDIGSDGLVYGVNNQYWHTDFFKKNRPEHEFGDNDFTLDPLEERKDQVAVPLPLVIIDPATGKQTDIFTSSKTQRRSQSIATNFLMEKVIATYPYSHTILVVNRDFSASTFDTRSFGISGVRGVCEIPFTSKIVITGTEENIAVIDLKSMERVQFFPAKLNASIHVSIRT